MSTVKRVTVLEPIYKEKSPRNRGLFSRRTAISVTS